jgi:hypothetical protein
MDKYLSVFEVEYNNYKINYNEEQLKFINSPLENSKLLGIPGGGKTQSIIGKVIHHYMKSDINQNNQFLILTFSRRACNDFIEKGKKQNKILFTTKNIRTLHSLSGKIVYTILGEKASSQDTVIVSSIDLIDSNKDTILEMYEFCNLKVIFVDEAQDISNIQYHFILKISQLTNCKIIMIGDPNQNIYQFQNGNDKYLINHDGETYSLIKNYRSTPFIVDFVNNFRPWDTLTPKMISTKDISDPYNKKPTIFNGTIEDIIKDIINKIKRSPFPKEQIAIIGPVKKSKPTQDSYTNIGLSLFTNLLNDYDIKFVKHYEDTNREDTETNESKRIPDHINLFTIHGSKGLEFHQVFLINFHTASFGIIPTEEKYKEFKYLWYVGLSRASYDLNIYIDKSKLPWDELKKCDTENYIVENNIKPQFVREIKFQDEVIPLYHSVTEILNTKKMIDDKTLFDLEQLFNYDVETVPLFDMEHNPEHKIKDYKEYNALYGMFIENIFNYYYNKKFNKEADFITKLKKIINNTVILPKSLISGYKILKVRLPSITNNLIKLNDIHNIKNIFKKSEEELYSYLCEYLNYDYYKEFFLVCENDVINYSKSDLLIYIDSLKIDDKMIIITNILKITIYYYQLSNETAYLWRVNFTEHITDLIYYIDKVILYAENQEEIFSFHDTFTHKKFPLIGELDLKSDDKIIDIKFSNNLSVKNIIQVLLYYHIVDMKFEKKYDIQIWNFHLGNKYIIKMKDDSIIDIFKLLKMLSKILNKKMEDMIFLSHLETTGEAYANKKMDIIDHHFEEYSLNTVISSGLLKPVHVPFIPFDVTRRTGITKEMVYETGETYEKYTNNINDILKTCNKPIFIAYNIELYDRKLFAFDKCKLIDCKMIIRLFLNDMISNKPVSEIFHYLFNKKAISNRAEVNVKMLISIFKKLNITEEKILSF